MRPSTILFALVGCVLAAPMENRLEDIKCRCISFSTDAKPTLCTHMESHAFDYHTASSLASDYDLDLQFASQSTITKVLSIHRPLPSGVLQRVSKGEVVNIEPTSLLQRENKIVCGFGDEVKKLGSHDRGMQLQPECHLIGYVLAALMVFTLGYVVIARMWAAFLAEEGTIKLEGDEKALMAENNGSASPQEDVENAAADAP